MKAQVFILNETFIPHLDRIKQHMMVVGSPVIRAIRSPNGTILPIEGSHRIRAAYELGLPLIIRQVEENDPIPDHDFTYFWSKAHTPTAGEIVSRVYRSGPCSLLEMECL
jgi:hypothetical protein